MSIELINTGILMGVIHVLTGPDHLSALATLSGTNISGKRISNFLLGIRWGLGHSLGLLVVGGTLIAMEESSSEWIEMDDTLSAVLEGFVGVFMLGLGFYGLAKACRNRGVTPLSNSMTSLQPKEGELELQNNTSLGDDKQGSMSSRPPEYRRASMEIIAQMSEVLNRDGDSIRSNNTDDDDVEARIFNAVESLRRNSNSDEGCDGDSDDAFARTLKASAKGALSKSFVKILTKEPKTVMMASSLVHKHAAPQNSIMLDAPETQQQGMGICHCFMNRLCCCCSLSIPPSALAFVAGIVHGVAGPGGVLGVIPAVQLKDAKLAMIYLGTFCITSTLVMGGFAAFYGSFSVWLAGGRRRQLRGGTTRGGRVFLVEVGSAFLSIAVGIIWLVLLSIGKLEELFP
ncbi:hypothetical protein ACHAXR_009901 [Thalassiosira sp. AJA248-18]